MDRGKSLYIGTSGLVLPYKNRMAYPSALEGKSRLSVYSTLFNSIEINSIFYKLPRTSTIAQWTQSVSPDFRFTFKLWKEITHSPSLSFKRKDLEKYFDIIAPARKKAGVVLLQFPPSVTYLMFKNLKHLLSQLKIVNRDKWPLAIEFRNKSWYNDATYALLNTHKAAMVFHDKTGSQSPQPDLDSKNIYLRFHGPAGDYKGSYDEGLLYEYAGYILEWLESGKAVYIYFNNTMGNAIENLKTLKIFLKGNK